MAVPVIYQRSRYAEAPHRMPAHAFAFWIAAPGRGEIRRASLGVAHGGGVVVRTLHSGVSRGTESLVFHGQVPANEYQRMRAPFQEGEFPGPVKYGYASVGSRRGRAPGTVRPGGVRLYPHQTRYVVPATPCICVPDGCAARTRGARRQHGDRRQRAVGCGAAHRRPHRRRRRRRGGLLVGWLAGRAARLRGAADRHACAAAPRDRRAARPPVFATPEQARRRPTW